MSQLWPIYTGFNVMCHYSDRKKGRNLIEMKPLVPPQVQRCSTFIFETFQSDVKWENVQSLTQGHFNRTDVSVGTVTFPLDGSLSLAAELQGEWTLTALRGQTARELITFRFVRKKTWRKTETEERIHFPLQCFASPFPISPLTSDQYNSRSFTGRRKNSP